MREGGENTKGRKKAENTNRQTHEMRNMMRAMESKHIATPHPPNILGTTKGDTINTHKNFIDFLTNT